MPALSTALTRASAAALILLHPFELSAHGASRAPTCAVLVSGTGVGHEGVASTAICVATSSVPVLRQHLLPALPQHPVHASLPPGLISVLVLYLLQRSIVTVLSCYISLLLSHLRVPNLGVYQSLPPR